MIDSTIGWHVLLEPPNPPVFGEELGHILCSEEHGLPCIRALE